jgi:hypothetical protein
LIANFTEIDRSVRNKQHQPPGRDFVQELNTEGHDFQGQYIHRTDRSNFLAGGGHQRVTLNVRRNISNFGVSEQRVAVSRPVENTNFYAYGTLRWPSKFTWTLGLNVDSTKDDLLRLDDVRFLPKFGVEWSIARWLKLRGAAFKTIKRFQPLDRTLEPTQIAGFSQFFDDLTGARTTRYGLGIDADLGDGLKAGVEASKRDIDIALVATNRAGLPLGHVFREQHEELVQAYLYREIEPNWAVDGNLRYERVTNNATAITEVETFSAPVKVRWFSESGLFASLGATYVHQDVSEQTIRGQVSRSDQAVLFDAAFGFRLPDRRGVISLEARNLFDTRLHYQDLTYLTSEPSLRANLDQPFRPALTILGRVTFSF